MMFFFWIGGLASPFIGVFVILWFIAMVIRDAWRRHHPPVYRTEPCPNCTTGCAQCFGYGHRYIRVG